MNAAVRGAAGLAVAAALAGAVRHGVAEPGVALAFGAFVAVGELVRTPLPGDREQAPLGAAGALAYALLGADHGARTHQGVLQVIAVVAAAALAGQLPHILAGHPPGLDPMARRVLCAGFAATLFQPLCNSGTLDRIGLRGPLYGLLLVGCAALAALCDVLLAALTRHSAAGFQQRLRDELAALGGIGTAVAASGLVMSLAVGEAGLWALPLFSVPLLLSLGAFRRHAAIRTTQRQTIGSLARATEVAGYTPPGHAHRVSVLARATGRELGLGERELEVLEYAALMHDVGQLSLVDPVPGGATVLLPPEEQRRIARLGSEVIRQTGLPPEVARVVARQAEPYRRPDGSRDAALPLAARVIRVVNAYADLAGEPAAPDERWLARRLEVLERLRLATAREYEPRVVEALTRVCTRL